MDNKSDLCLFTILDEVVEKFLLLNSFRIDSIKMNIKSLQWAIHQTLVGLICIWRLGEGSVWLSELLKIFRVESITLNIIRLIILLTSVINIQRRTWRSWWLYDCCNHFKDFCILLQKDSGKLDLICKMLYLRTMIKIRVSNLGL